MSGAEKAHGQGNVRERRRNVDQRGERAQLYRERAQQLRVMIPDMKSLIYAKLLERIAADYDELAARLEQTRNG